MLVCSIVLSKNDSYLWDLQKPVLFRWSRKEAMIEMHPNSSDFRRVRLLMCSFNRIRIARFLLITGEVTTYRGRRRQLLSETSGSHSGFKLFWEHIQKHSKDNWETVIHSEKKRAKGLVIENNQAWQENEWLHLRGRTCLFFFSLLNHKLIFLQYGYLW